MPGRSAASGKPRLRSPGRLPRPASGRPATAIDRQTRRPICRKRAASQPIRRGASMAADKHASVHWEGAGKTGKGLISTETGALKDAPYGFASRFEDDRRGTNPEEILGAAHAACFTMAFSFACDRAGFATSVVDTQAKVRLAKQ